MSASAPAWLGFFVGVGGLVFGIAVDAGWRAVSAASRVRPWEVESDA